MRPLLMALSIGAMPLGAALLYFTIARIVRLLRESEVARMPVAAESEVTFNAPGTYVLHVEQPRFSMAMLGATFVLRDAATGVEVRSSPVILRTTSSGFSTASVSVRNFEIERAGAFRFLVNGVDPAGDVSHVRLIFTRPYAAELLVLIFGTVLAGACLIGGLVFAALLYTGKL
jgi:hypothetical protein